jgi:hypothetical protein
VNYFERPLFFAGSDWDGYIGSVGRARPVGERLVFAMLPRGSLRDWVVAEQWIESGLGELGSLSLMPGRTPCAMIGENAL